MAEIPSQYHVIYAVAIFRVTLFDNFQPDQHPSDIQAEKPISPGLLV